MKPNKFENIRETSSTIEVHSSYKVDRNIIQVLHEDLHVKCMYADQGPLCSMNQGKLGEILKHQVECRACADCKYLCPAKNCKC